MRVGFFPLLLLDLPTKRYFFGHPYLLGTCMVGNDYDARENDHDAVLLLHLTPVSVPAKRERSSLT